MSVKRMWQQGRQLGETVIAMAATFGRDAAGKAIERGNDALAVVIGVVVVAAALANNGTASFAIRARRYARAPRHDVFEVQIENKGTVTDISLIANGIVLATVPTMSRTAAHTQITQWSHEYLIPPEQLIALHGQIETRMVPPTPAPAAAAAKA